MNFFTIRMSKDIDDVLRKLLVNNEKEISIQELNQNRDHINEESIFLLYVKGGKSNSEWWISNPDYRGTLFIATLKTLPELYDDKNYKIIVKICYRFNKPLTQEMCKFYPDTYNTEMGPKTKGSQTQAIAYLQEEKQILGILRAALFYNPEAEIFYKKFFGDEFLQKIKSPISCFVEKQLNYESEKILKNTFISSPIISPPHNRITFGAPGTGKSHTLKKDSTAFENQNVVDDIEAKIKNQFSLCDSYGDFVRLGFVYTDDFNQKTVDKINSEFNTKKGYWIKKGTLLREELKNVPNYQEEEFSEQVTNFIQSIPNRKKETLGLALGYKYSNLFSDISIETLQEEYKAVPTVAYWIIYGIQAAQSDIEKEGAIKAKFSERVTFHPNYSYAQFVGTYKPIQDSSDEKQITYQYVPGPFMRIYAAAKQNPNNNYLLLIEEINRANVAAVFGDVFQLLDRNADGESEYKVAASEDIKKYLTKKGIYEDELSIPSNMYIWATMNSADQGVFPMDTAFKRRWEFEYIGIDDNEDKVKDYEIPINSNQKVNWNELRKAINTRLIEMSINEDKLLGPFFLSKTVLENALVNPENFVKLFKSKVIMYLFEDAAKMKVKQLFKIDNNKYIFSEICKQFDEKGLDVFQIDTSNIKLSEVDNIKEDVIIPEGNTGTPSLFEQ